jgi:hypothetical protein
MRYVQYYNNIDGKMREVCGDRGIIILDGRNSLRTSIKDAVKFNGYRRPIYDAFKIYGGESIMRSNSITNLIQLNNKEDRI